MSEHLVAAYAVFWGFTFLFVLSLWGRQQRIQRDIEDLKDHMERRESSSS